MKMSRWQIHSFLHITLLVPVLGAFYNTEPPCLRVANDQQRNQPLQMQQGEFETPEPTKRKRPNVIIIFADDIGFGDLSCYGHPYSGKVKIKPPLTSWNATLTTLLL